MIILLTLSHCGTSPVLM